MEGTSSYGLQRHKSAGTVEAAMEHRVGFRDRICFVDRVGCRDRICFVDRVGFVGWKRMDRITLNQNKSKPATKLNLEHELRTAVSKTELCKS
jgi:hypothetical protein